MLDTPLTFEITYGGKLWFYAELGSDPKTIEYKKNNDDWVSITAKTPDAYGMVEPFTTVVAGDVVQFRGNNSSYLGTSFGEIVDAEQAQFNVKGNIMSLINSTNFSGLTTLSSNNTFASLFSYCIYLNDASQLILPATTLTQSCYSYMFQNCAELTKAPKLPATTLATGCYYTMFNGCTSLVQAPELPATTLTQYCYNQMFYGCSNLNYIKCLATDISASNCLDGWVQNVSSTGTFVKDANMTSWTTGNNGIPTGWTVQDAS